MVNVAPVWCGIGVTVTGIPLGPLLQRYFGRSVDISLLDDGVQGTHPEIDRSYSYGRDTDFVDEDNDGAPEGALDNHGTEMAGVIVARHNNGQGGAGIAPSARIYSTRIFQAASDREKLVGALEHEKSSTEIVLSGFGPGGNYVDVSEAVMDTFKDLADRKDIAVLYPAGEGQGNAQMDFDGFASHRYTIATAGFDAPSEQGCAIIATGPGADMATTDRTGADGDSVSDDYIFDFGGTSAATACTAGVVALMRDARPDLGWRDYQEILLLTGNKFDTTFAANGAAVQTPLLPFPIPFAFSYSWGGGMLDGSFAVALAEVWSRLPDSAALYRNASVRKVISDDIDAAVQTYLFNFNRVVPSKQNMRVEHIELRVEWEEPPNGAPAQLTPVYLDLVDPYYTVGPDQDLFPPDRLLDPGHDSILSSVTGDPDTDVRAPVEWTYTTVRHWGLINTGGFDRIGVPGEGERITPAGVWEVDVAITPTADKPTRRLIEMEMTMYGTENNIPPSVVTAGISSSGNPGVISPRTAFVDEDLLVQDIVFFDPEGDEITVGYIWQQLGEDGLTWEDLQDPVFGSGECTFDEFSRLNAISNDGNRLGGRYFIVYDAVGDSVAFWFQTAGSTIPAAAATADRSFGIRGTTLDEGAAGVAADIIAAVTAEGTFAAANPLDPFGAPILDVVDITHPTATGDVIDADPGTSNFVITREVSQDSINGNCFSSSSNVLPASLTTTEQKYRVIVTPRDGLREGFRFVSDEIIVNSRPITEASHGVSYLYDADLWIETVPPDDIDSIAFINEVSQGSGDNTTNTEWVEIMVNYSVDMRGFRLSNDIASFDLTFTDSPFWEEVPFGTLMVIYNGDDRDPIIPPDTTDFGATNVWIISSSNASLFNLPANGDGWGEFSNKDCTDDDTCDGAHAAILPKFLARNAIHGVSFNGNMQYTEIGIMRAEESIFFDGAAILDVLTPGAWTMTTGAAATPGVVNGLGNQAVLNQIIAEAKTSIPSYRFYPGDGTQQQIDPITGELLGAVDLVASDMVPGLSIDRRTGVVSGIPDVPLGGTFTIKIQRSHSFSSEIQIYELNVEEAPRLPDLEDEDDDTILNIFEEAFGSDAFAAEANILPTAGLTSLTGMDYPTITFRRLRGGVTNAVDGSYTFDDLVYRIQGSSDLTDWLSPPDIFILEESVVPAPDAPDTVDLVTIRILDIDPSTGAFDIGDHYYMRLEVTRLE